MAKYGENNMKENEMTMAAMAKIMAKAENGGVMAGVVIMKRRKLGVII